MSVALVTNSTWPVLVSRTSEGPRTIVPEGSVTKPCQAIMWCTPRSLPTLTIVDVVCRPVRR